MALTLPVSTPGALNRPRHSTARLVPPRLHDAALAATTRDQDTPAATSPQIPLQPTRSLYKQVLRGNNRGIKTQAMAIQEVIIETRSTLSATLTAPFPSVIIVAAFTALVAGVHLGVPHEVEVLARPSPNRCCRALASAHRHVP